MSLKYIIDLPIDSPERTILHGKFIKSKRILSYLYKSWYKEFLDTREQLPDGLWVELGSGGGFLKELEPKVLATDIIELASNDLTFSALEMPFNDNSVSCIFMTDTMHHIPDSAKFLEEVERVLKNDGQLIMIEPANTKWGRFIYQHFHHEPINPKGSWTIPISGPMSGANAALPWIVFVRDNQDFSERFPSLKITKLGYQNPILYLFSGGVSYKQLAPNLLIWPIWFIDWVLPKIWKEISMFMVVHVTKTDQS